MSPATRLVDVPGVGERKAEMFRRLGLRTVGELIRHTPMRYERESAEGEIASLVDDTIGSARGEVAACRVVRQGRKTRFEATLEDESGTLKLTWFNAGYLANRIQAGVRMRVQGKVKAYQGYPQIVNPRWELLKEDAEEPQEREERLRPVYRATDGLDSRAIERVVRLVLPRVSGELVDPLPPELMRAHNMPGLDEAFGMLHEPKHEDEHKAGRRRLAYNELLLLQLGVAMKRAYVADRLAAPALKWNPAVHEQITAHFPFPLTGAQDRSVKEIAADLQGTVPMNRLLQGDVGAGKTVVALYAMLVAVASGKQALLMAPTELLAEQHYASLSKLLAGGSTTLGLLTGKTEDAAEIREQLADGRLDLVVGTHALLSESTAFRDLGVVVIDEQHRFGVEQRAAFRNSQDQDPATGKTRVPHHLVMTATPIPRTLSLTLFGDLDVSSLDELPPGRTPVVNRVVGPEKSEDVYRYIRQRVDRGEQAYVVVPTIDASGVATEKALKSVTAHAKLLREKYFEGVKVEAVHGRLKPETRERVMRHFRDGRARVLVATTVIEVGVDVPNATLMVIEHAERFGLAQLHQLRGRVGRGTDGTKSLCVFVAEPVTDDALDRMDAIASTNDGFKIAEMDLVIRGMGEFFGTKQSGLPSMRSADLGRDTDLIRLAREDAKKMIAEDTYLTAQTHERLRKVLLKQYGDALGLVDVG